MTSDHVVVTSTTDNEDAARTLAAGVIEAKLGVSLFAVEQCTSHGRIAGQGHD